MWICVGLASLACLLSAVCANPAAKRLYDDLLKTSGYNKLVRPVGNNSDTLTVYLGLKLGQLIDVDEKKQIMTTNVWLLQRWYDYKLKWDPSKYGNVKVLYVPAEEIWLPDIVLYNNADGNYVVTIMTKAKLTYLGYVEWEPPAIYKSYCNINVEFFPFDEQECLMKFGSWTYHGYAVDLKHIMQANEPAHTKSGRVKDIKWGMDLGAFEESSEWDVLSVPARRRDKFYTCCPEPFPDVTFNITIRRKPLYYTVNLIIPCTAISSLTIFVFYLPSDTREKICLGIYTLVSLTVFFLVLVDINPPTSFVVPLMGKYLLFTMILIVMSIFVSVVVVSDNFRSPSISRMPSWVREVFIHILPGLLFMERPLKYKEKQPPRSAPPTPTLRVRGIYDPLYEAHHQGSDILFRDDLNFSYGGTMDSEETIASTSNDSPSHFLDPDCAEFKHPDVKSMLEEVSELAEHTKEEDVNNALKQDWKYVAMVLDRLLFWLFSGSWIVGTFGILMQAPMIYDRRNPLVPKADVVEWCGLTLCPYHEDVDYTGLEYYGAAAGPSGDYTVT